MFPRYGTLNDLNVILVICNVHLCMPKMSAQEGAVKLAPQCLDSCSHGSRAHIAMRCRSTHSLMMHAAI
jgi:hypothetical protein